MKKIILFNIILVSLIVLESNDTVINSSGSELFPIKETDIRIQKEILNLSLTDLMAVDVYFEFFNPGRAKQLIVGFVVEPKYQPGYIDNDSIDIELRKPDIIDFEVHVNGDSIPYEFGLLKDTPYKEIIESEGKWNFVYYFKVDFKEGLNIIRHRYKFNGGYDSSGGSIYSYVLKTAKNWAGGKIDDFTLIIDMGKNSQFDIYQDIVKNPSWNIVGQGKVNKHQFYIKDGYLELKALDFSPLNNIVIYCPPTIDFNNFESLSYQAELASFEELKGLDKSRLRILRNYFFAKAGFKFTSEDLFDYFSNYIWYFPDENLSSEEIFNSFDIKTKQRIAKISELEEQ